MRDLAHTVDDADLVQRAQVGREAAVDAEDAAIDGCAEREVVKHLSAVPPRVGVTILALALVIEPVDLIVCVRGCVWVEGWGAEAGVSARGAADGVGAAGARSLPSLRPPHALTRTQACARSPA